MRLRTCSSCCVYSRYFQLFRAKIHVVLDHVILLLRTFQSILMLRRTQLAVTRQSHTALTWIALCNAFDDNLAHNASLVKDDFSKNTFWKSKNYEFPVVLQLEVRRTFMLYQSAVTFYHELPAAMYLLKSNDSGRTWNPLTYFATNCTKYFNLPETPENEREGLKIQCFKIDTATNLNKQVSFFDRTYLFCRCCRWD